MFQLRHQSLLVFAVGSALMMMFVGLPMTRTTEQQRREFLGSSAAAMELSQGGSAGGSPRITRTMDSSPSGSLRVKSSTEHTKLRGAIVARMANSGECRLEAIGQRAVGCALKAIAALGAGGAYESNVKFKTTQIDDGSSSPKNLTVVVFEMQEANSPALSEEEAQTIETVRVSKSTTAGALARKISIDLQEAASSTSSTGSAGSASSPQAAVKIHAMGPVATATATRALCIAREMLHKDGVSGTVQFSSRFIKNDDLVILQLLAKLNTSS